MSFLEQGFRADRRKSSVVHIEQPRSQSIGHSVDVSRLPSKATIHEAANAEAKEHSMTVWEGLKNYKKAVGWSLCFSSAIIMEGYDLTIMGSFIISEPFIDRFGTVQADGSKIITAEWQSILGVAMQCGQILGLLATGILADKFGFKKLMGGALTWVMANVFILFFAQNI